MRRVEVKKIMKKNQVIITSLAILIAVAGYLNFADVDLGFKDKETSTDSSSILDDVDYDLTDETALLDENGADGTTQSEVMDTASPGEAVLTGASDFAAQAKVSREQVRSQNKADLQAIISNKDISEEEKQNAINTMVSMTDLTEKEAAAELLLEQDRRYIPVRLHQQRAYLLQHRCNQQYLSKPYAYRNQQDANDTEQGRQ